jgi:hypothetical protein
MVKVEIDNTIRYLPQSWNELTKKQLIFISGLFNNGITQIEFTVNLLFNFLQIKRRLWKRIPAEDLHGIGQTLNFLFENVNLTKALIPSFRISRFPWTRYYGPLDKMESSTFGEFTKAQVRYEQYNITRDPATLDELVAILFRRKNPFWFILRHFVETTDPRIKFMDRTLASRTKIFSKVPFELKYSVYLFFSGVYGSLPAMFPNIYRPKPSSTVDKNSGWATLIISLADGKTDDQSLDRIMNSNLYNVFMGLEQKSIEYFEFLKNNPPND